MDRRLSRYGRPAMNESQMRTPMRNVRGLGAAHSGTRHFWHQRVTSVAGIPLSLALLFIINSAYHMWIGMQEIILDYVHDEKLKLLSLMANTFFVFVVAFVSAYAILKLSFGV